MTASTRPGLRARPGTYTGLFLVTLSTLMYEIVLTRIFSVTMWYHFAFVAISVALFGLTAGALLVYLFPRRFRDGDVPSRLWLFALLFGVTLAVCFVTQLAIPFDPELNVASAWSVLFTCVVIAIPFTCSGVVVCLALTRFPAQTNRLYAVDLIGAALGCILVVALFVVLDGPSLMIAIGALAALGAFFFARDAHSRRGMAIALAGTLVLGSSALVNGYLHSRGHPLLRVIWAKGEADPQHAYERWNAFSRVTVDTFVEGPAPPNGVGLSSTMPDTLRAEEKVMLIDSNAATGLTRYSGDSRETDFLRYDVSNLAHYGLTDANVLVVGVGGGRDVLSALEFEQDSVTGVEINPNILKITNGVYGDLTGHLDRDPRVTFVADEARSYLARSDRRYDLIQISLIDTWAASSAGAYALSENSLYTTEAWDLFLDRLAPGGLLSVSRWYSIPGREQPLEAYRAVALASAVLRSRGAANPRDHLIAYRAATRNRQASAVTLLVSPEPLTDDERSKLTSAAERLRFEPVLTPEHAIDPRFAALAAPDGPTDAAFAGLDADISPPTDNRPFFFQMADLGTIVSGAGFSRDDSTRPVLILSLLAVAILTLAAAFILLPLLVTTSADARRGMAPFYVYFAGIGLGFLLIEIAQLQRLSVFLGHPTYALTVVLFSLLVASGIGSFASERLRATEAPRRSLALLGALVVTVAAVGALTPEVIERMDSATTPARIATAVFLLVPIGFLMGMAFPIGMGAASNRSGEAKAFLWGINGAASVCASVFGVAIAVFYGISTSYWTGVAAYVAAASAMVVIVRRRRTVATPAAADDRPAETVTAAA